MGESNVSPNKSHWNDQIQIITYHSESSRQNTFEYWYLVFIVYMLSMFIILKFYQLLKKKKF